MRQGLNVLYRNAAEDFACALTATLAEQVHAVVLFGSVARRRATRESDIDVLVVGAASYVQEKVLDIAYDVMERSRFETFINVVYVDQHEFGHLVQLGSPFISSVSEEGIVLYDDGIFLRARQSVLARR